MPIHMCQAWIVTSELPSLPLCLTFCPRYHKVSSYTEPKKKYIISVLQKMQIWRTKPRIIFFLSEDKVLFSHCKITQIVQRHKWMFGINYRHHGGKTSPTWKEFTIILLVCYTGVWNKDEILIIKDLKILKERGGIGAPGTWSPVSKGKEIETCLLSSVLSTWLPNSIL